MQAVCGGATSGVFSDCPDTLPGCEFWSPATDAGGRRSSARLFVSLERNRLTAGGRRVVLDDLDEVIVGRSTCVRTERVGRTALLQVGDSETSRHHLAVRRTPSGWKVEDLGSLNGTLLKGERVDTAELSDGDVIEAGGAVLLFAVHGEPVGDESDRDLEGASQSPSVFQTLSRSLEERAHQIRKIAPSRLPILIRGETGTGKELTARAIHNASARPGAFVAVNCGALPRGLLESELFGHRRGSFSGASEDREGLFRRADQGTLFLDEIAELPPESQVVLLRALQEGEVRPVGASEDMKVDVRVVAATHQDLMQRIADGRFRQDLYGRLAGLEITMPPLRDRLEDLGTLIAAMLPRICAKPQRLAMHRDAACALLRYPWPGNIRELEQALQRAVTLCEDGKLRLEHLPESIATYQPTAGARMSPEDLELRDQLVALLKAHEGNVAAVARAMGRARVQIRRWCRRLHIDVATFRR